MVRGGRGGREKPAAGSGGGSRKSGLRKDQTELKGGSSERNVAVQGSWIDSGSKCKVIYIGRASEEVSGDLGEKAVISLADL
jgi:hypothetical protein